MSNEFVVILGLIVSVLGGGACTLVLALLRQNEYLKEESNLLAEDFAHLVEELALAKENHRRNANIARRAFVREGKLEDRVTFLETSAKNGWEDAAEKWDSLLEARKQISDLKEKVETLEAWIASPPPAPTSKPAFAQD